LSTNWPRAQIETQYPSGQEAIFPLQIISDLKESFDSCIDRNGIALLAENETLLNEMKTLKSKGIRVRLVTDINEGNLHFCKRIMKYGEVFHKDKVKGNFQISDGADYVCYALENEGGRKERSQEQPLLL
jgi:hypothetical protein